MNEDPLAVIGSADGPTAVFLSGDPVRSIITGAVILLLIGIAVFLLCRKRKKKH